MIYADYAATTPMSGRAAEMLARAAGTLYGNPSSLHSFGQEARDAVEKARTQCAALIHAHPGEIVFTSGGTESDNTALRGTDPERLIVSAIEHPAVLRTAEALAAAGTEVRILPVEPDGAVSSDTLEEMLAELPEKRTLVSVMFANNETGVIQPVKKLAEITHRYGGLFHCDAVQGTGHVPVYADEIGCDLLSVSAHKMHGPKGIGFLYVRDGVTLKPILTGGGQEQGLRSGTESVPLIAAFGEACEEAAQCMAEEAVRVRRMRDRIEEELLRLPDVRRNGRLHGRLPGRLPGICSLAFGGVGGEALTLMCDLMGLAVSSGSACHAGDERPSHVLTAMGIDGHYLTSSLRISIGRFTAEDDCAGIVSCVTEAVRTIRDMSRDESCG